MASEVSVELKKRLLEIALSTDCVGEYNLKGWRLNAVCAARWLLRAAALGNPRHRFTAQVFSEVARAAEIMNDADYMKKIEGFMS